MQHHPSIKQFIIALSVGLVVYLLVVAIASAGDSFICRVSVCTGTPTEDVIVGNHLGQTLKMKAGPDFAYGRGGWDTLEGGDGADVLKGDGGEDILRGGRGNDSIFAHENDKQQTDYIFCGPGDDTVRAEPATDWVDPDCETVLTG